MIEKINYILKKYNNGHKNDYAHDMFNAYNVYLNGDKDYIVKNDIIFCKDVVYLSLQELLGYCILGSDPNIEELFFKDLNITNQE